MDLVQLRKIVENRLIKVDVSKDSICDTSHYFPNEFQSTVYEIVAEVDTNLFDVGTVSGKPVEVYIHKLLQQDTDQVLSENGILDFCSFGKALVTLKCLNEANIKNVAIEKVFLVRTDLLDIVQKIGPQNFFQQLLKFSILVNCRYSEDCLFFERCVFGYHFYEERDYVWIRVTKVEISIACFVTVLKYDCAPKNPQNNEKIGFLQKHQQSAWLPLIIKEKNSLENFRSLWMEKLEYLPGILSRK